MNGPGPVVEGQDILATQPGLHDLCLKGQILGNHSALPAGWNLQVIGVHKLVVGVQGQAALRRGRAIVRHLDKDRQAAAGGRAQGQDADRLVVVADAHRQIAHPVPLSASRSGSVTLPSV